MDELQAELQASQEVTDTIYRGLDGVGGTAMGVDDDDATLVDELNSLLRDTGEAEVAVDLSVFSKIPSVPFVSSITKRSVHQDGDAIEGEEGGAAVSLQQPQAEG